jgi:hypothetical protein
VANDTCRALLVGLMLSAPRLVQAQLSEALSIISAEDFPDRWPGLLPELITRLGAPGARDFPSVAGVLTTANTIFKRYRQAGPQHRSRQCDQVNYHARWPVYQREGPESSHPCQYVGFI